MRSTSKAPPRSSRARLVQWASRSSANCQRNATASIRLDRTPRGREGRLQIGAASKERSQMAGHGKKYTQAAALVDREKTYDPTEAVDLLKQTSYVGFDASAEAHIRLGVDPRHADQMVRGTVVLPHGTGKRIRVVAFAQGEKAQEALRSGADEVGGDDLAKRIEAGWLD